MRRVVIVAPNWLGDAIMALPAIADVRRRFAETTLHVAARASVAPFYELVSGVDAVVPLSGRGGWSAILTWREQANTLAAGGYDVAILLPNSFASALATARAGIPERWGFAADARRRLLTRAIPRPQAAGHHAAYYQALTTALDMPAGPLTPRIDVRDDLRVAARALLDAAGVRDGIPAVILAPGAAYGRAKQWVPERFAELAGILLDDGITPVLVGSGADRTLCAKIASLVRRVRRAGPDDQATEGDEVAEAPRASLRPAGVVNLCGRTDLPTLAGVLTLVGACVSNDSGAMHLAAAVGARVAAIFGPTNERRTAPLANRPDAAPPRVVSADVWCRPCLLRECPIDHRCMTRISARAVYDALGPHTPQPGRARGS